MAKGHTRRCPTSEEAAFMLYIGIVLTILILDLGIKDTIEETDSTSFPKDLEGTNGKIVLHKSHNDGFAMGLFRSKPEMVKMVPLMVVSAVGGIFAWLYPKKGQHVDKLAIAMVLGGALSNVYDRLYRGYVVDYFSIQWKKLKKVVFNLGDIFIFLGAGLLMVAEIVRDFRDK